MASIPFLSSLTKGREPLTGAKRIIVISAVGFLVFVLWASLAHVDEVTSGQGRVIPSSKVQLIQSAEPATVQELLVRSGQRVKRGQLLARLEDPQSQSRLGEIEAETRSLEARAS
jgi:adhesin transport system membrane fusion protein